MTEIPSTPGVYCLWNKITNQIYIGSAKDLNTRIKKHFSSQCQNPHLRRSIKKYREENFSITWLETGDNFLEEEQRLLDYVFNNSIPTFNVAVKAGGGKILSDYSGHRALSLKGKSREEWRALSEVGKSSKAVPLFLINTETGFITRIDSSYEGERLKLGFGTNLSSFSKLDCLNRVKSCLVARSESEAKSKLEAWLQISGNDTIDNPIVLTLGKSDSQSMLCRLANVYVNNFSPMYNEVITPGTGKPRRFSLQSKSDFVWYGTEVKAGDWFRCTKAKQGTP